MRYLSDSSALDMSDDLRAVPLHGDSAESLELGDERTRDIDEYNAKVLTYATDHEEFLFGFTKYQCIVLLSAWLGWGFDIFDAFLFTYAAPLAVPSLLDIDPSSAATKALVGYWTAVLTALLLFGWGVGGVVCGVLADRWGRARVLMFSIGLYSVATAACALSTSMNMLIIFRFVSALGIGGEWASGASLLAESMPEGKRVLAGALMFTAAPIGSMMGFLVNLLFDFLLPGTVSTNSQYSWRLVFASAILPVFITLLIRFRVKEPETWSQKVAKSDALSLGDLFSPELKRRTTSSIFLVWLCLIAWWCISSFLPTFSSSLAQQVLSHEGSEQSTDLKSLALFYNGWGSASLYIGGLLGAFSVVFFSNGLFWPRLHIFKLFFFVAGVSILCVYYPGLQFSRNFNIFRLVMMLPLGLATQGFFAIHSFYIPEQFPTAIRARGSGLTYNASRILTAIFPLTIGKLILSGINTAYILLAFAAIPVVGLIFLFIPNVAFETQHINLFDEDHAKPPVALKEVDADEHGDHKFVVLGDDEEFRSDGRQWWRGTPPRDAVEI